MGICASYQGVYVEMYCDRVVTLNYIHCVCRDRSVDFTAGAALPSVDRQVRTQGNEFAFRRVVDLDKDGHDIIQVWYSHIGLAAGAWQILGVEACNPDKIWSA